MKYGAQPTSTIKLSIIYNKQNSWIVVIIFNYYGFFIFNIYVYIAFKFV